MYLILPSLSTLLTVISVRKDTFKCFFLYNYIWFSCPDSMVRICLNFKVQQNPPQKALIFTCSNCLCDSSYLNSSQWIVLLFCYVYFWNVWKFNCSIQFSRHFHCLYRYNSCYFLFYVSLSLTYVIIYLLFTYILFFLSQVYYITIPRFKLQITSFCLLNILKSTILFAPVSKDHDFSLFAVYSSCKD